MLRGYLITWSKDFVEEDLYMMQLSLLLFRSFIKTKDKGCPNTLIRHRTAFFSNRFSFFSLPVCIAHIAL